MTASSSPVNGVAAPVATVNYHLWQPCNMSCGYCFATFVDTDTALRARSLPRDDSLALVAALCAAGFRKINFAGGEPTLCAWISDAMRLAKSRGLTTSIVTNGSRVSPEWMDDLDGCLDIFALSVDSVDADTQIGVGRVAAGKAPMSADDYLDICAAVKERGIRLKVNTVVSRFNADEDFRPFILAARPERWKIFQVLPVRFQNDARIGEFEIADAVFRRYVQRNATISERGVKVVPETNELMTGSYAMVDPLGRFYDDVRGMHTYSDPILKVGAEKALSQVSVSPDRFAERGGDYE